MLNIVVCDDEELHLENTARLVESGLGERSMELKTFCEPELMLAQLEQGTLLPDIAVLDIRMGTIDGIELARRINECRPGCKVIFLTSFIDYATEVYDTEHIYFVLKKDARERLAAALEKAVKKLGEDSRGADRLLVRQLNELVPLCTSEIVCMERRARKTRIEADGKELVTNQAPDELLADCRGRFIRCHNSFWVNYDRIERLPDNGFLMDNGSRIPISRGYKQSAREAFFSLLRSF